MTATPPRPPLRRRSSPSRPAAPSNHGTAASGLRRCALALLLPLALLAGTADAQMVSTLAGGMKVSGKDQHAFNVALDYLQDLGDYASVSATYINEGHPLDHHRDGLGAQGWLHTRQSADGWRFGVGVGEYYYFDTSTVSQNVYDNDHGWAPIASVSVSKQLDAHWYALAQVNRIFSRRQDGTTALLVGVGYNFDGTPGNKLHLSGPSSDDTITLSAGQSIVNSFDSETARALSLEYRRAISPYVDWTVTALREGSNERTRRQGVATQLWLIRSLTRRVELGMGAGPYVAYDNRKTDDKTDTSGLVSIVARYHFVHTWSAQLSWNRVITSYDRDADVFLLGIGKAF